MRKIRIFLIAPESELREDISDVLELENYELFCAPDSTGMEIAYTVFKPDVVMTAQLSLEQLKEVSDFFALQLNHPLVLIIRKWQFQANYDYYRSLIPHIRLITAPFTAEEMLGEIESLTKDVRADIDWMSSPLSVDNRVD